MIHIDLPYQPLWAAKEDRWPRWPTLPVLQNVQKLRPIQGVAIRLHAILKEQEVVDMDTHVWWVALTILTNISQWEGLSQIDR
jgi:hypothetical protein